MPETYELEEGVFLTVNTCEVLAALKVYGVVKEFLDFSH